MNRKQHSVVLASLLALALAGCSSTRGSSDEMGSGATASGTGGSSSTSGTSGTAGTSSSASGASGTSGASGSSGSMGGTAQSSGTAPATGAADTAAGTTPDQYQTPGTSGQASMPSAPPNAVVMTIEAMPRSGATGGTAAMGTSGTSGATGSSSTGDQTYRITLRMDDGTTRVVTQDRAPTFRNGDRVNMVDGTITK